MRILYIIYFLTINVTLSVGQNESIRNSWKYLEFCTQELNSMDTVFMNEELIKCIKIDFNTISKIEQEEINKLEYSPIYLLIKSHYSWIENEDSKASELLNKAKKQYLKETKGIFNKKKRKIYKELFNLDKSKFSEIEKLFIKPKKYPTSIEPASKLEIKEMRKFDLLSLPRANYREDITNYFRKDSTLGDINSKLSKALNSSGYKELSYYYTPNGFVVVSYLERTCNNGDVFCDKYLYDKECHDLSQYEYPTKYFSQCAKRFNSVDITFNSKNFSLSNYFKALFWGQEAYFRLFVFVVTNQDLSYKNYIISKDEARAWSYGGYFYFPYRMEGVPFSNNHSVTCLVYEFVAHDYDKNLIAKEYSGISALNHLQKGGILFYLDDE